MQGLVILYGCLSLYKLAVKKALEVQDLELAQKYAQRPASSKQRKELWMKILKKLILITKDSTDVDQKM